VEALLLSGSSRLLCTARFEARTRLVSRVSRKACVCMEERECADESEHLGIAIITWESHCRSALLAMKDSISTSKVLRSPPCADARAPVDEKGGQRVCNLHSTGPAWIADDRPNRAPIESNGRPRADLRYGGSSPSDRAQPQAPAPPSHRATQQRPQTPPPPVSGGPAQHGCQRAGPGHSVWVHVGIQSETDTRSMKQPKTEQTARRNKARRKPAYRLTAIARNTPPKNIVV